MQPLPNQPRTEKARVPASRPASARVLVYLGAGVELTILPNGTALAVHAEHLVETVRLTDFHRRST
jgi:hypothetical protein